MVWNHWQKCVSCHPRTQDKNCSISLLDDTWDKFHNVQHVVCNKCKLFRVMPVILLHLTSVNNYRAKLMKIYLITRYIPYFNNWVHCGVNSSQWFTVKDLQVWMLFCLCGELIQYEKQHQQWQMGTRQQFLSWVDSKDCTEMEQIHSKAAQIKVISFLEALIFLVMGSTTWLIKSVVI